MVNELISRSAAMLDELQTAGYDAWNDVACCPECGEDALTQRGRGPLIPAHKDECGLSKLLDDLRAATRS